VSRDAAAADQRRRILEATADLVAEQGYQGTTIETIVRSAKVGYATFYKHFADREAAFLALLDAAIGRTARRVEGAYRAEEGPWADRVGAALGALFEDVAAHPNPARAVLVVACAHRAPGLVSTLLAGMPQELQRAAGRWQAEWPTMVGLLRAVAGAAHHARAMLDELVVNPDAMGSHL